MSKIKIISNPYQKAIFFLSWDAAANQWMNIDQENNTNSELLQEKIRVGFFPFKVKQIVDLIVKEYSTGLEKVDIEFQGTDDEYRELEFICNEDPYGETVCLSKSTLYLENARDILPDVIDVFKNLKPLVAESVSDKDKVKRELEKFSDATNDIIPICVIGNYSSGKSTFINALIGYELLPSSDEPTTAKIHKITQSRHKDRAKIDFKYNDADFLIRFTMDSIKISAECSDNPLFEELQRSIKTIVNESIPYKINKVLDIINTYANKTKDDAISDLIEIETPFDNEGIWGNMWSNYVIFDTPGSNSASNKKHFQVLKKAMEDLSNGLPIFVSEYDSLDSTDNDKLYNEVNNMEELDNRFTMIIVNKADAAYLKKSEQIEEDRDRILNLSIPRKLYSGGVYFVSSIVGLGGKNSEIFFCDHNAEIFEDQKSKYINPESRFYKQLYKYNILPEQIKKKYDSLSDNHKNLLNANSGLYSVEQAIETFADTYSHYNKCQQSQLFLGKVIQITSDEIEEAKRKKEEYRERIHTNLEKEKSALIHTIDKRSNEIEMHFRNVYPEHMDNYVNNVITTFSIDELKEKEKEFISAKKDEKGFENIRNAVRDSVNAIKENTIDNFSNAIVERTLSSVRNVGAGILDNFNSYFENYGELRKLRNDVAIESSDELISFVKDSFSAHINEAQMLLVNQSRTVWAENTNFLKNELSQIITNTDALTVEERSELAGIIIEYRDIVFDNKAEAIFIKTDFLRRIIGDPNRLIIKKLAGRYNNAIKEQIAEISASIGSSHIGSFDKWLEELLSIIKENIVELSPQLRNQSEIIREETERIAELESRMVKLNEYKSQVLRMMEWNEL